MPNTAQTFLADTTLRAATSIATALLNLPEDKRNWSPGGNARTALDMVAECAINNEVTAALIEARKWADHDHAVYLANKAELVASGWESVKALLDKNTERLVAVIRAVPDDALDIPIETPYGSGPLSGIMTYPYWNMSYHEGQINYIGSLLGL